MVDFTAPSFSLGIDLDFDSDPHITPVKESPSRSAPESASNVTVQTIDIEDDYDSETLAPDIREEDPPRTFKRLKRGSVESSSGTPILPGPVNFPVDDDIEEFSSQEDPRRDEQASIQNRSACSSSKFSLRGHGVLTTQPATKLNAGKSILAASASPSANSQAGAKNGVLPNITMSPLRKIQLLDSDSDDPFEYEDQPNGGKKVDSRMKTSWHIPSKPMMGSEQKGISSNMRRKSLREEFYPKKNVNFATPALDEFCEEYLRNVEEKNVAQGWSKERDVKFNNTTSLASDHILEGSQICSQINSIHENVAHSGNPAKPLPPAYRYFYHNDPRIQKLVRARLSNFSPIGALNERVNVQSESIAIDYMGQFVQKDTSHIHGNGNKGHERDLNKNKKNQNNAKCKEVSQAPGSWVNPRTCVTVPKDAGKRRVHAEGSSAGHWYTGQDGRKVYINKNGQELTGQAAYRLYKKENGGLRKARKKAAGKKATGKKSVSKKRSKQ